MQEVCNMVVNELKKFTFWKKKVCGRWSCGTNRGNRRPFLLDLLYVTSASLQRQSIHHQPRDSQETNKSISLSQTHKKLLCTHIIELETPQRSPVRLFFFFRSTTAHTGGDIRPFFSISPWQKNLCNINKVTFEKKKKKNSCFGRCPEGGLSLSLVHYIAEPYLDCCCCCWCGPFRSWYYGVPTFSLSLSGSAHRLGLSLTCRLLLETKFKREETSKKGKKKGTRATRRRRRKPFS